MLQFLYRWRLDELECFWKSSLIFKKEPQDLIYAVLKAGVNVFDLSFLWIFNRCIKDTFFYRFSTLIYFFQVIWPLSVGIEPLELIWLEKESQKLAIICLSAIFELARLPSSQLGYILLAFYSSAWVGSPPFESAHCPLSKELSLCQSQLSFIRVARVVLYITWYYARVGSHIIESAWLMNFSETI